MNLCCICKTDSEADTLPPGSTCQHRFCSTCVDLFATWALDKCPLCRAEIVQPEPRLIEEEEVEEEEEEPTFGSPGYDYARASLLFPVDYMYRSASAEVKELYERVVYHVYSQRFNSDNQFGPLTEYQVKMGMEIYTRAPWLLGFDLYSSIHYPYDITSYFEDCRYVDIDMILFLGESSSDVVEVERIVHQSSQVARGFLYMSDTIVQRII